MGSHKEGRVNPELPQSVEVGKLKKQIQTEKTMKKWLKGWEETRGVFGEQMKIVSRRK